MEETGFPQVGQMAPSFKLPSLEHGEIGPEELRGKKVVIAFYPKDNTSG